MVILTCSKVVTIDGPSRSGKSEYLRNVIPIVERENISLRYVEDMIRSAPGEDEVERNFWILSMISQIFIEEKQRLIIIERGPWSCMASIMAHAVIEGSKGRKRKQYIEDAIVLARSLLNRVNLFVFVDVSLEVALERDKEAGASQPGRIINLKFFPILKQCYQDTRQQIPAYKIRSINGEDERSKNQSKLFSMLVKLVTNNNKGNPGM